MLKFRILFFTKKKVRFKNKKSSPPSRKIICFLTGAVAVVVSEVPRILAKSDIGESETCSQHVRLSFSSCARKARCNVLEAEAATVSMLTAKICVCSKSWLGVDVRSLKWHVRPRKCTSYWLGMDASCT